MGSSNRSILNGKDSRQPFCRYLQISKLWPKRRRNKGGVYSGRAVRRRGKESCLLEKLIELARWWSYEKDYEVRRSLTSVDVNSWSHSSRTRELPGYYPYDVLKELIRESKRHWRAEVAAYFDQVQLITTSHFRKLVENSFKYYKAGGLHKLVECVYCFRSPSPAKLNSY